MVPFVSILLAAYESLALATKRAPTITRLSHTKAGILVWLWLATLTVHLVRGEDAPALVPRFATVTARIRDVTRRSR